MLINPYFTVVVELIRSIGNASVYCVGLKDSGINREFVSDPLRASR